MSEDLSIGQGVGAGFAMLARAWRAAPGAVLFAVGASVVNMTTAATGRLAWIAVGFVLALIAEVVLAGALYRDALQAGGVEMADPRIGPFGLQWRAAEWRMLAVRTLTYLAMIGFMALLLAGFVAVIVMLDPHASLSGLDLSQLATGANAIVLLGAVLVFLTAMLWIGARLGLAPAIAVAESRIALGRAFRVTRGHTWPIVGATMVLALIMAAVGVAGSLAAGGLGAVGAVHAGAWINRAVLSLGVGAFQAPAAAGLLAYVYVRLCDTRSVIAAFD